MERRVIEGWRSKLEKDLARGVRSARGFADVVGYVKAKNSGTKSVQDSASGAFVSVRFDEGELRPVFARTKEPARYQRYLLDWAIRHSGEDFATYEDALPWLKENRLLSRREYWASMPRAIKAQRIARMVEYNRLYRLRNKTKARDWARKSRASMTPEQREIHLQERREKRLEVIKQSDRFRDLCYQQLLRLSGLASYQNLSPEKLEQRRIYAQLCALAKRDGCL